MPTVEERLDGLEALFAQAKKGEDLTNLPIETGNVDILVYNTVTKKIDKIPNALNDKLKKDGYNGTAKDLADAIKNLETPSSSMNLQEATDNGNETTNPLISSGDNAELKSISEDRLTALSMLTNLFKFLSSVFTLNLVFPTLTKNSTQIFQDKSGIIALKEDIEEALSNSLFVIIDGYQVLKAGKTDLENWEVNDKFDGWDGNNRVSGKVVGLPFDIEDSTKVKLALNSKIV